jgi:glycosyltransferase involved in cell wall biosynthesis
MTEIPKRGDQKKKPAINPLVSIVTPSLNHGKFIEETIKSVRSQDCPYIEHIIIDGGSTDNTLEVLNAYGDKIIWISEPDRGQADAVNKGLNMARGEILGWLNSDDTYVTGAIRKVVDRFLGNPNLVMVYGDAHFIDIEGNSVGDYPTEPFVPKRLAETCFLCQPAVFFRADVFRTIGLLDTDLHICLDYDYWIRISKRYHPSQICYLKGEYLADSRMYEDNKTLRLRTKLYDEAMDMLQRHFGYVSDNWISCYINEIILGNSITYGTLKNRKSYSHMRQSFLILYYVTKLFGARRGLTYLMRQLQNILGYLKRTFRPVHHC